MKEKIFGVQRLPCLLQKVKLLRGYRTETMVRTISHAMRDMVMKMHEQNAGWKAMLHLHVPVCVSPYSLRL